jgi:uncharacterized protein YfiM (DUF2279 family)
MLNFRVLFLLFLTVSISVNTFAAENCSGRQALQKHLSRFVKSQLVEEKIAKRDPWIAGDKGRHFIGSIICTAGTACFIKRFADKNTNQSAAFGMGLTFSFGLSKEIWDSTKKGNHFSYKDLIADILGIIAGGVLVKIE